MESYSIVSATFSRLFPNDFDRAIPVFNHKEVDLLLLQWEAAVADVSGGGRPVRVHGWACVGKGGRGGDCKVWVVHGKAVQPSGVAAVGGRLVAGVRAGWWFCYSGVVPPGGGGDPTDALLLGLAHLRCFRCLTIELVLLPLHPYLNVHRPLSLPPNTMHRSCSWSGCTTSAPSAAWSPRAASDAAPAAAVPPGTKFCQHGAMGLHGTAYCRCHTLGGCRMAGFAASGRMQCQAGHWPSCK